MITIGMLHHRKYPYKVIKSYAYAAVAKAEGVNFIYFSPKMVDFENRVINGYIYENGSWQKSQSAFPDVIYNAGSPEKLAKSKDIIAALRKKIPFTTNSLGSKLSVFERLRKAGKFTENLIPYFVVKTAEDIFSNLDKYEKIVLKPVLGQRGRDIYFISNSSDDYKVLVDDEEEILTHSELEELLNEVLKSEPYLIQPFIESKTKSGQIYDFRLHVQKNEKNNWIMAMMYPRVAPHGSFICNISRGGFTCNTNSFLADEFNRDWYNFKTYLTRFALQLAETLEEIHLEKFNQPLDELGIDVGIDKNRKLWIYEVNWRPGSPPLLYLELDIVRNQVGYAIYLANNR